MPALIGRMVKRSPLMVLIAFVLIGIAFWGMSRIPTAFIPIEDQGYVMINVQLPDGASLQRTDRVLEQVSKIAKDMPGVDNVITISGISVLDNNASLPSAGLAYVMLKDWSVRDKAEGQDLLTLYKNLSRTLREQVIEAATTVIPPPPIQGIGNAGGFTLMVEVKDGSADFTKLQSVANQIVANAGVAIGAADGLHLLPRLDAAALSLDQPHQGRDARGHRRSGLHGARELHRIELRHPVQQVRPGVPGLRPGGSEVPHAAGRYPQPEDPESERRGGAARNAPRHRDGRRSGAHRPLQPLSRPRRSPACRPPDFSSGQVMSLLEQIAAKTLPPGMGTDWTAMSYQEAIVGNQIYFVFGLAVLLVYFCLAGQYESWILPLSVILAVPLALLGTVAALTGIGIANNLYTQIGLILLIALGSKNAILIVEYAREKRIEGMGIMEAAVEAARLRFRPIIMTSFAFILGVVPLVVATGAGANARRSIGIAVFSGMLASTCLAVLFVPSFYVLLQQFEEWRKSRKKPTRHIEGPPPGVTKEPALTSGP